MTRSITQPRTWYLLCGIDRFQSVATVYITYNITGIMHACMPRYDTVELIGDIGVKLITTAFIQIDVGGCQQPAGWFDQLDSQWNVTQCVLDKVNLYYVYVSYRSFLHASATQ